MLLSKSGAYKLFEAALVQHAKLIIQRVEVQDYNRDGMINIDGFRASLRMSEVGLSDRELSEVFYLICGADQHIAYQSWILSKFPNLKIHFTINVTPRDTSRIDESTAQIEASSSAHIIDQSINRSNEMANSQHKYLSAKAKIEQYILSQDLNLGMMFAIMDTNSDSDVSFPEFKQKMRQMHVQLDEDEVQAIFRKLDLNGSGSIDFDEFVSEFAAINTEKIIKKIKNILFRGKIDPEYIFNKHCLADRTNQKLQHSEFKNLLKEIEPQLIKREVSHCIKHFDRGNKGQVTKTDFLHVISSDFIEQKTFNLSIEDVIKPLATKARKFNANIPELFDRYDKNRNGRLSAEELRVALA